jgi:HrpA-like RNA helicase
MNNKNINKIIHNSIKKINTNINNKYLNDLNNNIKDSFNKPIGLYDPYGENINPLTLKPYENLYKEQIIEYKKGSLTGIKVPMTYKNLAYNWTQLVIYENVNQIHKSIQNNQVTIIKAGTGVGKTVIVPKVALQTFNFQKKVICCVPKKIIAYTNAKYSAECLDVKLGDHVGYYYMGKNETNNNTKLIFTTPGSLKSKITGSDPFLNEYNAVIIDEIHERSVQTDQLLLMMKEIMEKRPDFKLILLSATIDLSIFKDYFTKKSNFTYNELDIPGITFDVKVSYVPKPLTDWKNEAINIILKILQTTTKGDILVFVKAGSDGRQVCDLLKQKTRNLPNINPFCIILEAKSDKSNTNYATNEFKYLSHPNMNLSNPYTRKIVMATNVAESSITVDGIIYVIDNGYAMESSYFPKENARSLIEERISKAAATQRKGRAGRTMPGYCYRLYTEEEYNKFPDFPTPDIQKTDITSDILDIYSLEYIKNTKDVKNFLNKLISPPNELFIKSALNKLYALGALSNSNNNGTLTNLGKALSKFRAIEPNFAKCILASYYYHCKYDIIYIILIAIQIDSRIDNLFERFTPSKRNLSNSSIKKEMEELKKKQKKFYSSYGDYFTLLNVYYALKDYMKNTPNGNPKWWCSHHGINKKIFINKTYPNNNNWDLIGNKALKLNDSLMKIVQPPELKKKYYEQYKKDGALENLKEINKEINNMKNMIIDYDDDILNVNMKLNNKMLQNGGYSIKPYELNLFPNALLFDKKENNILMCLAIGNITNIARLFDKKGMYLTCFPEKKVISKPDMNSTLSTKPSLLLYHELFTMRKNQNILKLNLVTKLPTEITKILKKENEIFIKICFQKKINKSLFIHYNKKNKKTKKTKKIKKKFIIKYKKR